MACTCEQPGYRPCSVSPVDVPRMGDVAEHPVEARCWADNQSPLGGIGECFNQTTHDIGLCAKHYLEIFGEDLQDAA